MTAASAGPLSTCLGTPTPATKPTKSVNTASEREVTENGEDSNHERLLEERGARFGGARCQKRPGSSKEAPFATLIAEGHQHHPWAAQ